MSDAIAASTGRHRGPSRLLGPEPWALDPLWFLDIHSKFPALERHYAAVNAKPIDPRGAYMVADDEDVYLAAMWNTVLPPLDIRPGGIAVIPVKGLLFRELTPVRQMMSWMFGGTPYGAISAYLKAAVEDTRVETILLDIDSPGGATMGCGELAEEIRIASESKSVVAYSGGICASAAYWLASATQDLTGPPSSMWGSIGVIFEAVDETGALAMEGMRPVAIVSDQSPKKFCDIATDDGKAQIKRLVNAQASIFVDAVARYRSVSSETVLERFGQGDVLMATDAKKVGMISQVGYLSGLLTKLSGRHRGNLQAVRTAKRQAAISASAPPIESTVQPAEPLRLKLTRRLV